ncbi:MAG: hypothetical protein H7329_09405 [Opitutaceae bacterium]|nr:hypothetical protein [Cytophagales bacterium]
MIRNTNFLVYQAYGITDVLNEAMVSIASLYKVTKAKDLPTIFIYTDSPDYFRRFLNTDINYIVTEKLVWEKWQGKQGFVHRAKIEMLLDFSANHNGNILYCDTDTYFLQSPIELFTLIENDKFVMHTNEGMLNSSVNKVFQKLEVFLKSYSFRGLTIPSSTNMWNAGVLGFKSDDISILNNVLSLADDLYLNYQKHVMEQMAFSYYFSERERLSCESTIFHYWDFKEYRETLKQFFEERKNVKFERWQVDIDKILPMELIKEKQAFLKKPYWKRKILKLIGKK